MPTLRITCNFGPPFPVPEGLMTTSDQELVRGTLAGDLRAFEQLVDRHRDVVLRVAARIVGEDEAEDVAQDVFLRAYHRLGRWRGEGRFRTWLLQIAHNSALDALSERRGGPPGAPAAGPQAAGG